MQRQGPVNLNESLHKRGVNERHTLCADGLGLPKNHAKTGRNGRSRDRPARKRVQKRNTMKHPTSRQLHAYWDRLRGERAAPERAEIEPGAIRNLLADSLILELDPVHNLAAFRLAGTRVCALFGRELKGFTFPDLWGPRAASGQLANDPHHLIETVAGETVGLVAALRGSTAREEMIDLELLLLPLRHRGRTQARMLGSLAPQVVPDWLGVHPVTRLETLSLRILGVTKSDDTPEHMPPPANDLVPMRRGHLFVHQGGRS